MSETGYPEHLIVTKLYPPRVPAKMVLCTRLLARMEQAEERRLTLISAPAGYGKTSLARQWASTTGYTLAWLSLDEHDDDLKRFGAYLVAALRTAVPALGKSAEALLRGAGEVSPVKAASALLTDLQALDRKTMLVLDDYHLVRRQEIQQFVERLVVNAPAALHLLISTRTDPLLPLSRLRGRGHLREIRARELRLDRDQAGMLVAQVVGEPVAEDVLTLLYERTEGWPAGLRLAAVSYRETGDKRGFLHRFASRNNRLLDDYLLEEVLATLPEAHRQILLRTAVTDRFNGPLLDVLTASSSSGVSGRAIVRTLWRENLFVVALDDQGTWYRYHQLFRQLLLRALRRTAGAEEVKSLHLAAADWFAGQGLAEEAITHYLHAAAPDRAARLVELNLHTLFNREQWRTVERWLSLLPEHVSQRPGLLAGRALIDMMQRRLEQMYLNVAAAQQELDRGGYGYDAAEARSWQGVINCLEGHYLITDNDMQRVREKSELALERLDPQALYVRSLAEFFIVMGLQMSGDASEALRVAKQQMAQLRGDTNVRSLRVMLSMCGVYHCTLAVESTHDVAMTYLRMAQEMDQAISAVWAYYVLGNAAYQGNRLGEAEGFFRAALGKPEAGVIHAVVDSFSGLATTYAVQGRKDAMRETLASFRAFVLTEGPSAELTRVDSLTRRLDSPEAPAAPDPAWTLDLPVQVAADMWETPALTACLTWLRRARADEIKLARHTLARCKSLAAERFAKRILVQVHLLEALAAELEGVRLEAMRSLEEAVALAAPGRAMRYFLDVDAALLPLLQDLHDRGIEVAFLAPIVAEAGAEASVRQTDPQAEALLGQLSNREMEVLDLLAQRKTNKEIGAELHISPRTVTKHTVSIYRKMAVSGRRAAVARAVALGLVPSG